MLDIQVLQYLLVFSESKNTQKVNLVSFTQNEMSIEEIEVPLLEN